MEARLAGYMAPSAQQALDGCLPAKMSFGEAVVDA